MFVAYARSVLAVCDTFGNFGLRTVECQLNYSSGILKLSIRIFLVYHQEASYTENLVLYRENKFGLDWSHVLKTRLNAKRGGEIGLLNFGKAFHHVMINFYIP
jgi:hypothetical protein